VQEESNNSIFSPSPVCLLMLLSHENPLVVAKILLPASNLPDSAHFATEQITLLSFVIKSMGIPVLTSKVHL